MAVDLVIIARPFILYILAWLIVTKAFGKGKKLIKETMMGFLLHFASGVAFVSIFAVIIIIVSVIVRSLVECGGADCWGIGIITGIITVPLSGAITLFGYYNVAKLLKDGEVRWH